MEQNEITEQTIRDAIKSNAEMLMAFAHKQMVEHAGGAELFDTMKPEVQAQMLAVSLADYLGDYEAVTFTDDYIDNILKKDDQPELATGAYIYFNWRVFAVYENNIKLAKAYQALCDKIDDYIFEHWKKESVNYFVRETD